MTEAKGDRFKALYVLAVTTGLRQGELLGLMWEDVDLDNSLLMVRRTLQALGFPKGAPATLTEPKTPRSRRSVKLTAMAVEALKKHQQRQDEGRQMVGSVWKD